MVPSNRIKISKNFFSFFFQPMIKMSLLNSLLPCPRACVLCALYVLGVLAWMACLTCLRALWILCDYLLGSPQKMPRLTCLAWLKLMRCFLNVLDHGALVNWNTAELSELYYIKSNTKLCIWLTAGNCSSNCSYCCSVDFWDFCLFQSFIHAWN